MPQLLIANIGNRNIKYRGEFIRRDEFRTETHRLLDNYETAKHDIQLNILDVLLDEKSNEIDRVILFASDQEVRHHQDTLYEAEILIKKIEERYQVPTEVKVIQCSVIDNNALLSAFRSALKQLLYYHSDHHFIICDSGGTAQQKSSLKIMTEYLLPTDRFRFYHIAEQKEGPSSITEINQREYRNVIDTEQMTVLIEQGNYSGAVALFTNKTQVANKHTDKVKHVLQFASARKANLLADARKLAGTRIFKKHERATFDFLDDYEQRLAAGRHFENFDEVLSEDNFFYLCELLSIAEYETLSGNENSSLIIYSTFVETYLSAVLESLDYMVLDSNRRHKEMKKLKQDVANDAQLMSLFDLSELDYKQDGIPTLLTIGSHWITDSTHRQMVSSIKSVNSILNGSEGQKGLDVLRNQYAHKGRGITHSKLTTMIPRWPQIQQEWHNLFGLPDENVFVQMNKAIINYLR